MDQLAFTSAPPALIQTRADELPNFAPLLNQLLPSHARLTALPPCHLSIHCSTTIKGPFSLTPPLARDHTLFFSTTN